MAKNIIFCADGTWNNPDNIADGIDDSTNVDKLFSLLQGSVISNTKFLDSTGDILELEKSVGEGAATQQIAKYINGVGNSKNKIKKLLGGSFGAGLVERIVRGYTFISRNYALGDRIYIIGFSRGAYTARALAGMIAHQGLLNNKFNRNSSQAYEMGTCAWYRYRQSVKGGFSLFDFASAITNFDMPAYFKAGSMDPNAFLPISSIECVAVWDTVGSMGIPNYDAIEQKLVDNFRFADTKLSTTVQLGLHAIALDEQRLLFTPTLWERANNVKQMVFPGGHSDVGGGYLEKGLSDAALQWMINELSTRSVQFASLTDKLKPNPGAAGHQEWRNFVDGKGIRVFDPNMGLLAHSSVDARKLLAAVPHHLGEAPKQYSPGNWPPTI